MKFFVCVLLIFGIFACAGRQAMDGAHCCAGRMTKQIAAVGLNCDASIPELVTLGRYDGVEQATSANFEQDYSCSGRQGRILWLVNFNHIMTTRDAVLHLRSNGLRSATLRELLALGIMHRDMQLRYPIVALGSYSPYGFPILVGFYGRRSLLVQSMNVWDEDVRFLAVRLADR